MKSLGYAVYGITLASVAAIVLWFPAIIGRPTF